MPFNLKQFLRKIDKAVTPKVEIISIPEPVQEPKPMPEPVQEPKPKPLQEPIQEISIPEYVPIEEPDSEPDVHAVISKKRKRDNKDVSRKVPLNPLSDE
jgi:hypothetical protein